MSLPLGMSKMCQKAREGLSSEEGYLYNVVRGEEKDSERLGHVMTRNIYFNLILHMCE